MGLVFDKFKEKMCGKTVSVIGMGISNTPLINMLVDKKDLAKTSSQPGKTQLINHFLINEEWYLVDLPGYGYAKTSMENRKKWRKMIEDYLVKRVNLVTVFVKSICAICSYSNINDQRFPVVINQKMSYVIMIVAFSVMAALHCEKETGMIF